MEYLNEVRAGDIWITNCDDLKAFEYLIKYQAEYPKDEVWLDVPKDMSDRMFEMISMRGYTSKIPGATQQELIDCDCYGVYRRPIVVDTLGYRARIRE